MVIEIVWRELLFVALILVTLNELSLNRSLYRYYGSNNNDEHNVFIIYKTKLIKKYTNSTVSLMS